MGRNMRRGNIDRPLFLLCGFRAIPENILRQSSLLPGTTRSLCPSVQATKCLKGFLICRSSLRIFVSGCGFRIPPKLTNRGFFAALCHSPFWTCISLVLLSEHA